MLQNRLVLIVISGGSMEKSSLILEGFRDKENVSEVEMNCNGRIVLGKIVQRRGREGAVFGRHL